MNFELSEKNTELPFYIVWKKICLKKTLSCRHIDILDSFYKHTTYGFSSTWVCMNTVNDMNLTKNFSLKKCLFFNEIANEHWLLWRLNVYRQSINVCKAMMGRVVIAFDRSGNQSVATKFALLLKKRLVKFWTSCAHASILGLVFFLSCWRNTRLMVKGSRRKYKE